MNVVVKGGHLEGSAVDLLFDGRDFVEFAAERIAKKNTHGTGCIFASALVAGLAKGKTVRESVALAKKFVTACQSDAFAKDLYVNVLRKGSLVLYFMGGACRNWGRSNSSFSKGAQRGVNQGSVAPRWIQTP